LISFRIGHTDAEILQKEFGPVSIFIHNECFALTGELADLEILRSYDRLAKRMRVIYARVAVTHRASS
jgi:hypothetical protein